MRAPCIALMCCWIASCGSSAVGGPCSDTAPCAMPLVCAPTSDPTMSRCMRACEVLPDGGSPRLCSDGAACIGTDGERVCYIGGRTSYATTCTGALACEPGTLCSEDAHVCEQVCTIGEAHTPCRAGEVCTDVLGGLCRAAVGSPCDDLHPCATMLTCTTSGEPAVTLCADAP